MQRRVADEPFAEPHARHVDLLAVLHGELHLELAAVVQQQDAERAVVDHALGELRDPREQLIEIEHRGDFAADFGERLERVGVAPAALEQPRVDQRDRHVRRELAQDRDVALGELVAVAAEDIERADRLRLVQSGTTTVDGMPGTTPM